MEKLSRTEAARLLKVSEEELSRLCKEHLTYRVDYFMHRKDGTQLTADAIGQLKDIVHAPNEVEQPPVTPKNALYVCKPDEVVYAKVCNQLPPNARRAWITVPGVDHRCEVNIPPRFAKLYRKPGKRIAVRHVGENVYQMAIVNFRDE